MTGHTDPLEPDPLPTSVGELDRLLVLVDATYMPVSDYAALLDIPLERAAADVRAAAAKGSRAWNRPHAKDCGSKHAALCTACSTRNGRSRESRALTDPRKHESHPARVAIVPNKPRSGPNMSTQVNTFTSLDDGYTAAEWEAEGRGRGNIAQTSEVPAMCGDPVSPRSLRPRRTGRAQAVPTVPTVDQIIGGGLPSGGWTPWHRHPRPCAAC